MLTFYTTKENVFDNVVAGVLREHILKNNDISRLVPISNDVLFFWKNKLYFAKDEYGQMYLLYQSDDGHIAFLEQDDKGQLTTKYTC